MSEKTWKPGKPKPSKQPKVPEAVRNAIDLQAAPIVAGLKKRYCKKPKNPRFNWPHDFFARWHRNALYFVVLMRTGHDSPDEFETHAARIQYVSQGKFDLAFPIRRGWMTVLRNATADECLEEVSSLVL